MDPLEYVLVACVLAIVALTFSVAMANDRTEQLRRQLAWTQQALEGSNIMVAETLKQSGRMARLAVDRCGCQREQEGDRA